VRFVVEVYAPAVSVGGLPQLASRAYAAAQDSSLAGVNARYLRSVLAPEDETCFHHSDGSSAEAVRRVSERAGLLTDDECASVKPCLEEGVTEPKGGKP
jgi:hypothetical protein